MRIKNNSEKKLFFRIIFISLFALINLVCLSFAQESQVFQGKINADNVNIRFDATVSSSVISRINKGDRVEVMLELYEWYKIKLPKAAPSFIKKNLVSLIDDKTAQVLKDRVNIRLRPDEASPILGRVDKNEVINILEDKGLWYRIEPVNNSFGWIHKKFVEKVPAVEVSLEVKANTLDKTEGNEITEQNTGENKTILPEASIDEKSITVEGIINPYGKVFRRIATHKFITQDGKIFLLKGSKENLDSLNYRKVKVTGKLSNLAKQKYPIIEILKIEVLD